MDSCGSLLLRFPNDLLTMPNEPKIVCIPLTRSYFEAIGSSKEDTIYDLVNGIETIFGSFG